MDGAEMCNSKCNKISLFAQPATLTFRKNSIKVAWIDTRDHRSHVETGCDSKS
jgi:hypothetical protein